MFSENHGIVAREFDVEDGVAKVGIGESAGLVELLLDSPAVTRVTLIFVGTALHPEKVVGDVFDCIEAKSVGLGAIHEPSSGPDQVSANILGESGFVGVDVGLRLGGDFGGSGIGAQFSSGLIDQNSEVGGGAVLVLVILFGAGVVANKGVFGSNTSFAGTEVGVRSFVGDIDEVGEAEVLHLPGGVPVATVVPLAVEAVFGFS